MDNVIRFKVEESLCFFFLPDQRCVKSRLSRNTFSLFCSRNARKLKKQQKIRSCRFVSWLVAPWWRKSDAQNDKLTIAHVHTHTQFYFFFFFFFIVIASTILFSTRHTKSIHSKWERKVQPHSNLSQMCVLSLFTGYNFQHIWWAISTIARAFHIPSPTICMCTTWNQRHNIHTTLFLDLRTSISAHSYFLKKLDMKGCKTKQKRPLLDLIGNKRVLFLFTAYVVRRFDGKCAANWAGRSESIGRKILWHRVSNWAV